MLNKFKNAIYGSSGSSGDTNTDDRESVLGKKVRTALTRSTSFREDLLNGSGPRNRAILSGKELGTHNGENSSKKSDTPVHDVWTDTDDPRKRRNYQTMKFPYRRPDFLQLKLDEINVTADHCIRPIILPKDVSRFPWGTGYAECINAGKSIFNEDQATCYHGVAFEQSDDEEDDDKKFMKQFPVPIYRSIPWVYFAVFDGHAGYGVSTAASNQLHHILAEKLNSVADKILMADDNSHLRYEFEESIESDENDDSRTDSEQSQQDNDQETSDQQAQVNEIPTTRDSEEIETNQGKDIDSSKTNSGSNKQHQVNRCSRVKKNQAIRMLNNSAIYNDSMTADVYIRGALEASFLEFDALVGQDKLHYKMTGGCTAIVGLFILGKLYVCNAGDSRAIVCKANKPVRMSYDFTPITDQQRIARLAQQCPQLLCDRFTQIEYHPRHPTKSHLGRKMLYRDAFMTGYSLKTITPDDLKYPLISGEGKRSRLLATIGVTRGFGDHEMRSQYGSVPIKPFLTAEPQIEVMNLREDDSLTADDVLIIGTDGLWDVTSVQQAVEIVSSSFNTFPESEESRSKYRYMTAAQDLIINSRGTSDGYQVWTSKNNHYASHDDITVFVIPLKPYKQEYEHWLEIRSEALARAAGLNKSENLGVMGFGGEVSTSSD